MMRKNSIKCSGLLKSEPEKVGKIMLNQTISYKPFRTTRPYYDRATRAEYRLKINLLTGDEQPQIFRTSSKIWHDCEWKDIPLHIQLKLLGLVK